MKKIKLALFFVYALFIATSCAAITKQAVAEVGKCVAKCALDCAINRMKSGAMLPLPITTKQYQICPYPSKKEEGIPTGKKEE